MNRRVAVAIVGFRNPDDVSRCLAALANSTQAGFEVVICENGGRDAYEAMRAAAPARLSGGQNVDVILAPGNLGFAGGVKVCIERTPDADAWWILNPDTEPNPDALSALLRRLSQGDCDAVGCTLLSPDGEVEALGGCWRAWIARAVAIGHGRPADSPIDALAVERAQNFLMGASMLVSSRFVEHVGLMREDYFLYGEEVEWCLRAIASGMKLGFAPDAQVVHYRGTSTGAGEQIRRQPRLPVYLGERNRMLLTRDRFGGRLPVAAAAALALLVLRYPARGAWRQFGYALSGWWAGLLGERGAPEWVADLQASPVAAQISARGSKLSQYRS